MDLFTQLFAGLLAFVYHCFDRIVIYGYLSGLSRSERLVNFFHQVVGVPVLSREILSQRTADYQNWVTHLVLDKARITRSHSKRVIYAVLGGNVLVAMTKFVTACLTGSAAMLSEAIHSTVDSGNQLLLLLGMRRPARPADTRHSFGHGLQLYFWTFVGAVLIFGVGAAVSVVDGISKIRSRSTPRRRLRP